VVGPVLKQEMMLGGRRNRLHVLRWLYAALLVVEVLGLALMVVYEEARRGGPMAGGREAFNRTSFPEVIGDRFSGLFVSQQMIILMLLTPAFVAGAITDEKRSGTLQYLALTDLESRHVVLGKLLARLCQVALVMLAGWPLFALMAGFGGIPPVSMAFVLLVVLMPMFGLAAATLLTSVFCRQTRDAVVALYLIFFIGALVVYFAGGWLSYLNPLWVLSPAWGPPGSLDLSEAGKRLAVSSAIWGAIGATCTVVAAARLMPVFLKQMESRRPEQLTWYQAGREAVPEEPVRWRETQVEGLAPFAGLKRVPQWLAISLIVLLSTASSLGVLYWAKDRKASTADVVRATLELNVRKASELLPGAAEGFWYQGLAALLLWSLVVGIRCSGSIALEREKQTWEAVLLTPMTAKQIVRGKLWGVMGASGWYLLAYAAPAVSLSAFGGPLALCYTLLWIAVTVLGMYFIGAAGLWCSVRAKDSWRSLIHTLAIGYVGGLVLGLVLTPAFAVVMGLLLIILLVVDFFLGTALAALGTSQYVWRVFFISSCIGMVVAFWLIAAMFVNRTVRWIADRDRTRHWYDEPTYRRSRRPELPLRHRI
jgi:ABC-type transport system involved in multi-copper enzyme maturation permease subunit